MPPPFTISHFSDADKSTAAQKPYGNVGYRIVEASIHELLADPGERATWC